MKRVRYYFNSTHRRKMLDNLLKKSECYIKDDSIVLDIGGRDRGIYRKPKNRVKSWIFVDIEPKHNPDVVVDVAEMSHFADHSVDIILAIELFEHVERIKQGLKECHRVLKSNGVMILSVPFLYRIHDDPCDYQRWTKTKWEKEFKELSFEVEKFIITGNYFTVMADNFKIGIQSLPKLVRYVLYIFLPFFDIISLLDEWNLVKRNKILNSFHDGYFVVLRK